jgi:hypothetical protein
VPEHARDSWTTLLRDPVEACGDTFVRSSTAAGKPTADDESGAQFLNGACGWDWVFRMKIRVGFEMIYDFPQPTPLIALVGTHFTRAYDILVPDYLTICPSVPITPYRDGFGNWCSRIVAPAARVRLAADGTVRDSGLPDVIVPAAAQHAVEDLPAEAIVLSARQPLLRNRPAFRYCVEAV